MRLKIERHDRCTAWGVSLLGALCLTACAESQQIHTSVDIPIRWMPTDTLCIPLEAVTGDRLPGQVEAGGTYRLTLGARYSSDYPYRSLALHLVVRYTDSLGRRFVVREVSVELPLTDADGAWLGGNWGSMIQWEAETDVSLPFPYVGDYTLCIAPVVSADQPLHDLSAIMLTF